MLQPIMRLKALLNLHYSDPDRVVHYNCTTMAKGKSFLIYIDISKNLELLSDEEAGKVFKAIVEYVDIGKLPQFGDRSLQVFFNTITDQIDRDREKYEKKCGANRENQQKRWKRIREMESHFNTNVYDRIQSYTNV